MANVEAEAVPLYRFQHALPRKLAAFTASVSTSLIVTELRFALNSADMIQINCYPEGLKIRPQTPNNRSLFKFWVNVQRNSHQLKLNDHANKWSFSLPGRSKSEFLMTLMRRSLR